MYLEPGVAREGLKSAVWVTYAADVWVVVAEMLIPAFTSLLSSLGVL